MAEQMYRKCGNEKCDRRVLGGTHCCTRCISTDMHHTEGHLASCNQRAEMRGPYQPGRDFSG